ncbi:unnamed protein product [Phytophthora lilii]|uniref:Unnamed protein product n=1 Tax=Phytophthora lilii TaxID=2077276 RepID=A0A9W6YHR6_9STRA|nr:unnamed protein product [Phytophthora lilii]
MEDASCATGGLGCFPDGTQCRFCRETNSSQSEHLQLCSDIQVSLSSSESVTTTTTTLDSHESAIDCLSLVSVGDQGVGISAVAATNPTCATNGLGCFQTGQCRFCQSRSTIQSAPYLKCADVGGSSTSTSTPSTTSTPAATAASTSTSCSSVVSRSSMTGISYVSESRCNVASPTLLGCSPRTSCRLCRDYKNEDNQYLVSCQVLKDQATTESAPVDSASSTTITESTEYSSATDTIVQSSGKLSVSTSTKETSATTAANMGSGIVAVAAAAVAALVVVMMSIMYVKGRRDPLDECMTPDDDPDGDLLTPHGGRGYTPREGSLVMVVSQSSIATL